MKCVTFFSLRQDIVGRLRQLYVALIVNVLYLSTGLTIGWPSPTLPVLREDESILGGRTITVDEESWLGSLPYLGGLVATPFHSYINQNFGRKSTGYFTALSFALGWLCISFGNGIAIFCIGRFILGMGLSGTAVIGTLYIGETSQDDMRGRLGVIRGVLKHTGIILVYVIGTYLSVMNTALVCASFILVFLLSFFFMPESPMFLLEKGKTKETLDSYVWLRGGDTQFAEQEVTKLSAVVDSEKAGKKPSLREILSVKGTRKALIITAVLSITQQFGGLNVVYSYCASIIELTGGDVPPHIASFIASFAGLAGSVLTCFTSDRLGRKFFLISTNALMAILLVSLGVYSYLKSLGIDVSSAGLLPVICISLYCGLAIAGPFNIYYVVLSEIFRPEARGLGMIVANVFISVFSFLSTKIFPYLTITLYLHGSLWLFAVFCLFAVIFTIFYLPETKNRSLQSILNELNSGPSVENNTMPTCANT
ncbi:facilitated trehalose transporter Tret1-like isoform X2 [Periplaneta americana]|uniref:facilitated trehalose transporter Tret1-like isoform X2 n=1 Tax=Periplaneta americana TaxID=6978 RepID=UPI0037E82EAA